MTGSPDGSPRAGRNFPPARRFAFAFLAIAGVVAMLAGCDSGTTAPAGELLPSPPPAHRIVALSPALTELAYAAGAGSRLVGAVAFSDEPVAARALPRVGDAFRVDLEILATLHPDLILGWPSGNSPAMLTRLRELGYRVVDLEPRELADIGEQIELIGRLAGTLPAASAAAGQWREGLAALEARYAHAHPGRVFYQIAAQPLVTVNRRQFIGQAIELCGGVNVFADVPGLAPVVSMESVIRAAPDVIVASDYTPGPARPASGSPVDIWKQWSMLPAVANHRLFVIDPTLLAVPGPRLLEGIQALCVALNGPAA